MAGVELAAAHGGAVEDRVLRAVGGGSVASGGRAEPAGAGARAGARRGGKKGSESSLGTLRNSGAVNLSRRRHGVDSEMVTTREKEDTTTKRTTS